MASDDKWKTTVYTEEDILAEIPATRSHRQFRSDMLKVMTKWARKVHSCGVINSTRQEAETFLLNLETLIDVTANEIDPDETDPQRLDENAAQLTKEIRWLTDIASIRTKGVFNDDQREQTQPQAQVQPTETRADEHRPEQPEGVSLLIHPDSPVQDQPQNRSNQLLRDPTTTWRERSSFYDQHDETVLPPGLREEPGHSFIDRLPLANSTCISDENKLPTLTMFYNPPARTVSQDRINRWKKFKGEGKSVQPFTGDPLDFARYVRRFYEEVAENVTISWSSRYEELSLTLPPDVRRLALRGTDATRDGYMEGWEYLFNVYNSKSNLLDTSIAMLEKLKPVTSANQVDALHELCSASKQVVRSLLAANTHMSVLDTVIQPIIYSRCPETIQDEFIRFYGKEPISTVRMVDHISRVVNERLARTQRCSVGGGFSSLRGGGGGRRNPRPQTSAMITAVTPRTSTDTASQSTTTVNSNNTSDDANTCAFCSSSEHRADDCQVGTVQERTSKARQQARCFRCLVRGHRQAECRARMRCSTCNGNHPKSLCRGGRRTRGAVTSNTIDTQTSTQEATASISAISVGYDTPIALPISIAQTTTAFVCHQPLKVLMDSGALISCIKKSAVERLYLKRRKMQPIQVKHFGSDDTFDISDTVVTVTLQSPNGGSIDVTLAVTPDWTLTLPTLRPDESKYIEAHTSITPANCLDADGKTEVDIILGAYHLGHISRGGEQIATGELFFKPTMFGDVLFGHRQPAATISAINVTNIARSAAAPDQFVRQFLMTIERNSDGRYVVQLPAITLPIVASSNEKLAKSRWHQLVSRAKREQRYGQLTDYFNELIKEQIIEPVASSAEAEQRVYLPYHYIIKESSLTTKMRAVFDGSAGRFPINDALYKGVIDWDLVNTITSFRLNRIGVMADVAKAFLQVEIAECDRDLLCLWWDNVTYRFCRMPFGLSCSPFLLSAVFLCHMEAHRTHDPSLIDKLEKSFYVDDLIISLPTPTEVADFKTRASKVMDDGHFNLRKWRCSHHDLDNEWAPGEEDTISVLGLRWNVREDTLSIPFHAEETPPESWTKRQLASILASLYDPLGLFGPVAIRWRRLFQLAWKESAEWDETLSTELQDAADQMHRDCCEIPKVKLPRHAGDNTCLIIFSDASKIAYGAVAYFGSRLIQTRSHLARLYSNDSIAKSEWNALMLAGEMIEELRKVVNPTEVYLFCDSRICLDRLLQHPNQMKALESLQAMRIRSMLNEVIVGHVDTKLNRADILSRGAHVYELNDANWWTLRQLPTHLRYHLPEPAPVTSTTVAPPCLTFPSHWTAQKCVNLCYFLGGFVTRRYPQLTRQEIAWLFYHRICQRRDFPQDLAALQEDKTAPTALRWNIAIIRDDDGLLRVPTRLELAPSLTENEKRPLLVSEDTAKQLVRYLHAKSFHSGLRRTLLDFRSHYFTRRSRQLVKAELKRCRVCRTLYGKTATAPYGLLPPCRTTPSPQYEHIGMDIFNFSGTRSYYGLIVTCLVTRAVHVELVPSLSASDLLFSLRQFFALYTVPRVIVTDNGTNFRRVAKAFAQLRQHTQQRFNVRWTFSCPSAPWRGGVFERMVQCVKKALSVVHLHRPRTTERQLRLLVYEVCASINNRPLIEADGEVISPNSFAARRLLPRFSNEEIRNLANDAIAKTLATQRRTINGIWSRWYKLYLFELRNIHKTHGNEQPMKVGDTVLIDTLAPRQEWPLATIHEVIAGPDGYARTYVVKFEDGTLSTRPAQRLLPLEGTWTCAAEDDFFGR